jgi:sRNA-binding carbon storage regulator CsrA
MLVLKVPNQKHIFIINKETGEQIKLLIKNSTHAGVSVCIEAPEKYRILREALMLEDNPGEFVNANIERNSKSKIN